MEIDINSYSQTTKQTFIRVYERTYKGRDDHMTISFYGAANQCHLVPLAYWLGEHLGWTPEICEIIKKIKANTYCDKVKNKPVGCPEEL